MRLVLLLVAISGCTLATDHAVIGTYLTNFDGPVVTDNGQQVGAAVVDVMVQDDWGPVDHEYFHSETVDGNFDVRVPDGDTNVHVVITQHTGDQRDHHVEYLIDGPITADVDLGTVDLTQTP